MARLTGRIALITGAGAGIGQAIANDFAQEGAELIINDINLESAQSTVNDIIAKGGKAHAIQSDICDIDQVRAMMEEIKQKYGRLDTLVNNAGIIIRSDFRHMEEDQVNQTIDTNLNGTIRCIREAFPVLKESERASVVNLSSVMAFQYLRQLSLYSVTKAAVDALTKSVALEFAQFGIRVNYVAPGYVDTKMTERFLRNPRFKESLIEKTAQKRLVAPEHIAKAVTFLASDDAEYITGSGLTVDGGITLSILA